MDVLHVGLRVPNRIKLMYHLDFFFQTSACHPEQFFRACFLDGEGQNSVVATATHAFQSIHFSDEKILKYLPLIGSSAR